MTSTLETHVPTRSRPPLVTRPLALRFVSMVGASASFFMLLSVVPMYATASGGGGSAAGLATGALMLSTVLGELATPRIVARFGYRLTLGVGLVLLGAPAVVLTISGSMPWIVAVCLIRGLGFAVTVVAGGALTASLIPAERRGEGLALVGVVSGVPSLLALPLGVWLASHIGYGPVGIAGGACALVAIAAVPGLPARDPVKGEEVGVVAGLRTSALARPAIIFAATALAAGIIVTFLPLAVPSASTGVIALALLLQPGASMAGRWVAGRYGDRRGSGRLVLPSLVISASGMLLVTLTSSPLAVVAGVTIFGAGFGVAQNATLTLMYSRVSSSGFGTVSALWNFAYDAGMGVGAVAFGAVAGRTGYSLAFALTAALMLCALVPALRDRP